MTIFRSVFVNILFTTVIITYYFSIGCYGLHLLEPNKAISRSDESTETYGGSVNPPQSSTEGCILPQQPSDGNYTIEGANGPGIPNEIVEDLTLIKFECNNNFYLYPPTKYVLCIDNNWVTKLPRCLRTCPPRVSESVQTVCKLNGIVKNCSEHMVEDTKVTMNCKHFYTQLNDANHVSICKNGSWDSGFIKCAPVCGKKIAHGATLLAGGQMAKKGNFPWHVGIYRKKQTETSTKHKCSGSIISVNVVLSAARCFTSNDFGTPYPTDEFYVAAGKYYSAYDEPLDNLAQKRRAKNIIIPLEYAGSATNYQSDIAIVVLQTSFQLTHVVQPVCVDWPNEFEDIQLRSPNNGIVSGWGLTQENGKEVSKELRTLVVSYLSRRDCYGVIPKAFYPFLTQDKFCAGYSNDSSACEGDSGGGLVFYKPEDDRYYIRGLVSNGTCDTKSFGTYTRISDFLKQISEIESVNKNYNS